MDGTTLVIIRNSKILKIPQRYVFAFFSAATALKLAFVDRRLKPRSPQSLSTRTPNTKRSLFQRILARLRG